MGREVLDDDFGPEDSGFRIDRWCGTEAGQLARTACNGVCLERLAIEVRRSPFDTFAKSKCTETPFALLAVQCATLVPLTLGFPGVSKSTEKRIELVSVDAVAVVRYADSMKSVKFVGL